MSQLRAISAAQIFDGFSVHTGASLLVKDGLVEAIVPQKKVLERYQKSTLAEGFVVPGFVDLQVNGGGGVLFNDDTSVEGITRICQAHLPFGTTSLLPTLITDSVEKTNEALVAAKAAEALSIDGFLGLHLEGPHIDPARHGAHQMSMIRSMSTSDIANLKSVKAELENLLITVAPVSVSATQVRELSDAGVRVSLGHTDASFAVGREMIEAGCSMVTHLYNAMSGLEHRAPGVVGVALESGDVYAGLIADGYHVDYAAIRIAIRSKQGPGKLFLVTDAMSLLGTDNQTLELNGRVIHRQDGRLLLSDGTLAGADLDMISAIRNMIDHANIDPWEAYRMASLYPAQALGADSVGRLTEGARADFVQLDENHQIVSVWQKGESQID